VEALVDTSVPLTTTPVFLSPALPLTLLPFPFIADLPFLAVLLVALRSSSVLDASASDFTAGDGDQEEIAVLLEDKEADYIHNMGQNLEQGRADGVERHSR
jgi:hypothetical protein